MLKPLALAGCLLAAAPLAHAQDQAALLKQHSGGTLRLTANGAAGSLDVQINYMVKGWQLAGVVYDGLVSFKKVAGPDSATVVPDLADAIPAPTNGGKTYVFHLRPGIKFSTGKEVTTADVAASFQRLFKVGSPNAGSWFNVIVGADACLKEPTTCTLAGGVVPDESARTVTINLTAPDSEFLDQIATPFGSVIPADTPPHDMGTTPMPGTGPYMFQSYDPNKSAILVRNPYFKQWSADAQPAGFPDRIEYSFGLENEAEVTAVINGQYDWMFEPIPLDRLAELGTRYQKLVHIIPDVMYQYLALNNRTVPFNNEDARKAIAYAVDRRAVVNLYGGPRLASPLCQTLPKGVDGFEPYCPYSKPPGATWTAPDMDKARALMKSSGMIGQKVTIITQDGAVEKSIGVYLQSLLNTLGFQTQVKAISSNIQFTYIQNTNNKVQASETDWEADYPAASDFLHVLFTCSNFHPGSDASINIAGYCDKTTEAMMDDALATAITDPKAADAKWAAVDKRITDASPVVTLFQRNRLDLLSPRVGNWQWSKVYNMLFSQVWVK